MRYLHDKITFHSDGHREVAYQKGNHFSKIRYHRKGRVREKEVKHVLLAVNPLELGIEVVRIAEFDLKPNEYLLDGETINAGQNKVLIRRPVCLFEVDAIRRIVQNGGGDHLGFRSKESPDAKTWEFEADEFYFFDEDIELRKKRVKQLLEQGFTRETSVELKWNEDWLKDYEELFQRGKLSGELNRFLPSAWKTIEQALAQGLI